MNSNIVEGDRKPFKGNGKQQWAKLTDDRLEQMAGQRDLRVVKSQKMHDISKDEVEMQIKAFEDHHEDERHTQA